MRSARRVVIVFLIGTATTLFTASAPAQSNRCAELCNRVARCNVPIFWGVTPCIEYCTSGKYGETFACLDSASKTGCHQERIEACIDPCDR